MPKYALTLSYDGTDYVGWQIQPHGTSIQGKVEEALRLLLRAETRIFGAGRTDAGTHALGQVAHFSTPESPPLFGKNQLDREKFLRHLNGLLPYTIRALKIIPVPDDFHAQYSAHRKTYHYHLWLDPVLPPFVRNYRHHVRTPLNLSLLEEALHYYVGTHDFTSFANVGSSLPRPSLSEEPHPEQGKRGAVRTLLRFDLVPQEGGVRLECEGEGFLYKMVRNCVGTAVEVALGKRKKEEIPLLLTQKRREAAGAAAPAKGLFLVSVSY